MGKGVAIVGGGFTGLACGVALVDQDFQVTIFESSEKCGGLASGFHPSTDSGQAWKWSLEFFYHHIFRGDREIQNLANKVEAEVFFKEPLTTSLFHLRETQLDSPLSLLKFSGISFPARIRMGLGLAVLRIIPNGAFLEKYRVVDTLPRLLGREGYETIWKKLLVAKFGPYTNQVNMAWFWTRVAKRSKSLGYFKGGFGRLILKTEEYIKRNGGEIRLSRKVNKISRWIPGQPACQQGSARNDKEGVLIDGERFDAVVMTIPAPAIKKLIQEIDFPKLDYLWGQTLVLETSKRIIKGYWMNILEDNWPFLVMVEHTNFIDKKNYGADRIVYLGNYLPEGHKQLKMTKEQLLNLYAPFIRKINRRFKKNMVKKMFLFREPFAQPVFPINYSKSVPKMKTPIKGIYMANMSMVYPFDRGTNYAVKMGGDVAKMIIKDLKNT